jgi:hypothetical protein
MGCRVAGSAYTLRSRMHTLEGGSRAVGLLPAGVLVVGLLVADWLAAYRADALRVDDLWTGRLGGVGVVIGSGQALLLDP